MDPSAPEVSIILPVFNGEAVLGDAVRSVLRQDMPRWELLIVNDGSLDGTAAQLAAFDDRRIKVVHQENLGVSAARNRGLELASGRFVTFLDADDELPVDSLTSRLRVFVAQSHAQLVDGAVEVVSEDGATVKIRAPGQSGPLLERLMRLDERVFFGVCYMLRRCDIMGVKFPEGVSHGEDLLFLMEIVARHGDLRYASTESVVYRYRRTPRSAMTNLDGLEHGYVAIVRFVASRLPVQADAVRFFTRRVRRILVRSWLRRFRPDRALRAWLRVGEAAAR